MMSCINGGLLFKILNSYLDSYSNPIESLPKSQKDSLEIGLLKSITSCLGLHIFNGKIIHGYQFFKKCHLNYGNRHKKQEK